jgi:hypothetical protein
VVVDAAIQKRMAARLGKTDEAGQATQSMRH